MYRVIFGLFLLFLVTGCGGSKESHSAPRITNLTVTPQVICVGTTADISFTLVDSEDDEIIWVAGLDSGEHGGVVPATGRVSSGTRVSTKFDAATSGRHNHNVILTIDSADITGLKGQPVKTELYVFNCS